MPNYHLCASLPGPRKAIIGLLLAFSFLSGTWANELPGCATERYATGGKIVDRVLSKYGTLYSGGNHFHRLDDVGGTVDLYRLFNDLPDLNFVDVRGVSNYPFSLNPTESEDHGPVSPEERLGNALAVAVDGNLDVYGTTNREDPKALAMVELDRFTTPVFFPVDWHLAKAPATELGAANEAVRLVAKQSELLDWLQTTATAAASPWAVSWHSEGYPLVEGYCRLFVHAARRFAAGDGWEWAAAALEIMPPAPGDQNACDLYDPKGLYWELRQSYDELSRHVANCEASDKDAAAYLLMTPSIARLFSDHSPLGDSYHGLVNLGPAFAVAPRTAERTAFNLIIKGGVALYRWAYFARDRDLWYAKARGHLRGVTRYLGGPKGVAERARLRALRVYFVESLDELSQIYGGIPFDGYAQRLINFLPYSDLAVLAGKTRLHPLDRAELARVAFTRAVALGRYQDAVGLLPLVAETNPSLSQAVAQILGAIFERRRRQLVALLILRNPGFNLLLNDASTTRIENEGELWRDAEWSFRRPDENRPISGLRRYRNLRNWWCATEAPVSAIELAIEDLSALLRVPEGWGRYQTINGMTLGEAERALRSDAGDQFHTRDDVRSILRTFVTESLFLRLADWGQLQALSKVDCAPKMLAEAVIEWAGSSSLVTRAIGWDGDLPEALHRTVVSTRYGCNRRVKHGRYSRRAYQLLHKRYPDSAWAKKTPYWFD